MVDVSSPRDVINEESTRMKAEEARLRVERIFVRSPEYVTASKERIDKFFAIVHDVRTEMVGEGDFYSFTYVEGAKKICERVAIQFGLEFTNEDAMRLIRYPIKATELQGDVLKDVEQQTVSAAALVMTEKITNREDLESAIGSLYEETDVTGLADADLLLTKTILQLFLEPNMILDEASTKLARESAYQAVINNPDIVEKGARILSQGDEITPEKYALLVHLDMIERSTFDYGHLLRIFLYVGLMIVGLCVYLMRREPTIFKNPRMLITLALSLFITLFSSIYLSDLSPLLIPVFFPAVVIAIYMGSQSGLVLSTILICLLLPVSGFDSEFFFVAVAGSFICCMIAGDRKRKYNSALLIFLSGIVTLGASVIYNLLMKSNTYNLLQSAIWASLCGIVSVILAIGLMPIFELISNSISPVRLIDLAQPGQPLQKRLFMEAPGTYQHSMMVATLSETAAEEIGANALLAKVGALYHDIGKLDNPEYFTENQSGENPHDHLTPEESFAVLMGHVDNGMKMGRRQRLPIGILRFIQEHHGTQFQAYFYQKSKEIALAQGLPEPSANKFRYRGPIPGSKETAIVMLADTCEAALKSTGIRNLSDAQDLFRKLIKQKIDQDQMTHSALSFTDIESIIKSFLHVYTGVFHERIKYPDDNSNRK